MLDPKELLALAEKIEEAAVAEASRMNSAYDYYGMNNTPESVDPEGMRAAAILREVVENLKEQNSDG